MILNRETDTTSVIIFIHIPKTGGCTLHSIIHKQYRNYYDIKPSFWWRPPEDTSSLLDYLDELGVKKLEVLRGHIQFGIHKHLPQKKYTYITLVRNPIERVVSLYYYIRSSEKDNWHHIVKKMTLYEFVTSNFFNPGTLNVQTRLIAGNNRDDLKTAKNNLKEHFSVVGITERFDETLCIIEKKLGWKVDKYENQNVTKNRPSINEIPNEIIEIIVKKNQKDIELYNFANKLLDEQINQYKDSFS